MQGTNPDRFVYLVDGARTPFLKAQGKPGDFSASDLAVCAARPLLARQPVSAEAIDQVIVGCVMPSAEEANIGRLIALRLGLSQDTTGWTVQRNCASGLQALDSAVQSIASGTSNMVLAGGTEAMSQAPLLYNDAMVKWFAAFMKQKALAGRAKVALQFRPNFLSPVIALLKGLTDPTVGWNMGQTAEELAFLFDITRHDMDSFAAHSHQRALAGQEAGAFAEVVPAYSWKGNVHTVDDGIRTDSTVDRLGRLRPVFDKYGNVSAGNSSQISDGAAFTLLASAKAVKQHNLPVLARVVDVHWAALDPRVMGLGPVHAIVPLLKRHQLTFNDLGAVEINEAFAAQVLACQAAFSDEAYCQKHLGLDEAFGELSDDKLNPDGGAIAIGHPVGASGARLALHLANTLQREKSRYGVASLCIGGGQGGAILLERTEEVLA